MRCPRCDEGALIAIKFKSSGKHALWCNFCDALWFDHEMISVTTGHTMRVYSQGKEHEFDELDELDQEHQPVRPIRHL